MNDNNTITMPAIDDFHVHLRQELIMKHVVPMIKAGGSGRVLVMPNLTPPVTTVSDALAYQKQLQAIDPSIDYLMTIYLTSTLDESEIKKAAQEGITGIKFFPKGVTTNSESGSDDIQSLFPVFQLLEENGLVLNIHGELPADSKSSHCVMDAEQAFLPILKKIHIQFPKLKIVLEHVSCKEAVNAICSMGDSVAATITPHHLELIVDDWAGNNFNYCKPVAKRPADRDALRMIIKEGNPKFFLGSDSAPHPVSKKEGPAASPGIFTTPFLLPYLADVFERFEGLEKLENFCTQFGRNFYGLPENTKHITIQKTALNIPTQLAGLIPFRAGETLNWQVLSE